MNLKYVLSHRNYNDQIYTCDIVRYFGVSLFDREKISELRAALEEMCSYNPSYKRSED
jgi:hypothetical protein